MVQKALDFMVHIRPIIRELNDPQRVFNMDQTPIFFSMHPSRTIERRGANTVNVRKTMESTLRVTVAVGVSASGEVLKPLIVFKGTENGRIARSLCSFPEGAVYATQKNAWMDERVMKMYIDEILTPLAEREGQSLILLDSYRCHMMPSVISSVKDLNMSLQHIPSGVTGLVQPVDVGINKPLKVRIRRQWETWVMEHCLPNNSFRPPPREVLAAWIIDSLRDLPPSLVCNSWRKTGMSYFE